MTMDAEARESVLVVVEGEAACPFWMDHWGDAPKSGWSMIEQEMWEPSEAFAERLQATLERTVGGEPEARTTVILVASGNTEASAMAARWQLSAAVMNHLGACSKAELLLSRGYGHDGRPEPALSALAADLVDEWEGSGIAVRLCLNDKPPASQVRASAAPPRRYSEPAMAY